MQCPCCQSEVDRIDPRAILAAADFGPVQRHIIDYLVDHFEAYRSTSQIAACIYARDPDGGPEEAHETIRVLIFRIRRRASFKQSGFEIQTGHRGGYRLTWADEVAA